MRESHIALLAAERRARALLQREGISSGDTWTFSCAGDADGLALLAAARLAARWGAGVHVSAAERGRPDGAWEALRENCRALFPDMVDGATVSSWKRSRKGCEGCDGNGSLPDAREAWKIPLAASSPWVRRAGPDDAPLTCAQCREIDRRAIGDFFVPGISLMENAAVGATIAAADMLSSPAGGRMVVVAGGGNNGGDGLAMARGFAALNIGVDVVLLKPRAAIRGDAGINLDLLPEAEAALYLLHDAPEKLGDILTGKALIVDGLLGTGFKGALSAPFRTAIDAINAAGVPVLALDLPSGMNGDDGSVADAAVRATRTVTFAAIKTGFAAETARERLGDVFLADIGAPLKSYPRPE